MPNLAIVIALFNELVPPTFNFLISEFDMAGPAVSERGYSYSSPDLAIVVALDARDGVYVGLSAASGELTYRSSIQCLYTESNLGPAQSIKTTARTSHTLRQSLESNALALRSLLPKLRGGDRQALFSTCHGR